MAPMFFASECIEAPTPHCRANLINLCMGVGPAIPTCTGSAMPCSVIRLSQAQIASGLKPNWVTMWTLMPVRAPKDCL